MWVRLEAAPNQGSLGESSKQHDQRGQRDERHQECRRNGRE
jgi:hypothetical protein